MSDFYRKADDNPLNRAVDKAFSDMNQAFISRMNDDPDFRDVHDRLTRIQSEALTALGTAPSMNLYTLARTVQTIRAILPGGPRASTRLKNIAVGRTLGRGGIWRRLWGPWW